VPYTHPGPVVLPVTGGISHEERPQPRQCPGGGILGHRDSNAESDREPIEQVGGELPGTTGEVPQGGEPSDVLGPQRVVGDPTLESHQLTSASISSVRTRRALWRKSYRRSGWWCRVCRRRCRRTRPGPVWPPARATAIAFSWWSWATITPAK